MGWIGIRARAHTGVPPGRQHRFAGFLSQSHPYLDLDEMIDDGWAVD
jgi:hypothetical protein